MALERKDRIQEQTTTTGTGTVDLNGTAPDGFETFVSQVTSGATIRYSIESNDLSEWEVGEGVFTDGSPDTISRVTVYASSNSGALVNFSAGTKVVTLAFTAGGDMPDGELVGETDAQTLTNKTLTTPKIGTSIDDSNGNEVIKTPAAASAVNEVTIKNAVTGDPVEIEATGDDTNIDIVVAGKGTGVAKDKNEYNFVVAGDSKHKVYFKTIVIADMGTGASYDYSLTIPSGFLSAKPSGGICQSATGSQRYGSYNYDDVDNSATRADFVMRKYDGTNWSNEAERFTIIIFGT